MQSTFQELLRSRSLRATRARLEALRILADAKHPVTARDLRALIKADLVTVYRILQSLVEAHIIREVRFKDAAIRYEYARDQHHHHTVCTACGVIEELPECTMALDASTLRRSKRFAKISEHSLEFFGICMTCARR